MASQIKKVSRNTLYLSLILHVALTKQFSAQDVVTPTMLLLKFLAVFTDKLK
jgi:hypothetical protein